MERRGKKGATFTRNSCVESLARVFRIVRVDVASDREPH